MRIVLALALVTVTLAFGCVRAPAQSVDPNRCNCTLQQNQNGGGAYYPYSGR